MDIHVELGNDQLFFNISDFLTASLPHDEINFRGAALPHVTLYMTDFKNDSMSEIIQMYESMLVSLDACRLHEY